MIELIELVIFLTLGILIGIITGLTPGIHINLIASFLISFALIKNPINFLVFAISMSITHTFLDFIPSIYLGAPDEDTALGILPGHKMLLKGKAHLAVYLTLLGSFSSIFIAILITPILFILLPKIYPFIQRMMSFFLIWISIFLLSKTNKKILSIIIFTLAGFLGYITLNLNIESSLLPLLTGLFGSSTLIYSIKQKTKIPKQNTQLTYYNKKELSSPLILTTLISPICCFTPGIGSSQSAIIASSLKKLTQRQFLILLGSINTLIMITSFLTLYLIQKSRTGIASAINQIIQLTPANIILILIIILITSLICFPLTLKLSKLFAINISKLNYTKLCTFILIFLTIIITAITKTLGLLIFIASTILGLLCIQLNIRKSYLMGSLLIPTIILYLP